MKKQLLSFLLFGFMSICYVFAQDMIIVDDGREIDCRIISISNERIHFLYYIKGRNIKTSIPTPQVKKYYLHPRSKPEIQDGIQQAYKPQYFDNQDSGYCPLSVVVEANAGWSYRNVGEPPGLSAEWLDMYVKTRKGKNVNLGVSLFYKKRYGLGIKYTNFWSEYNNVKMPYYLQDDVIGIFPVSNNINMNMVAIGPSYRYPAIKHKLFLTAHARGVWFFYREKLSITAYDIFARGKTFGADLGVGIDYMLANSVGAGVSFSYLVGEIKQFDVDDDIPEFEELMYQDLTGLMHRFDISAGLRWYF